MSISYEEQTPTELHYVDVSFAMPYGTVVGRWYGSQRVRPLLALHGWLDNLGTWNRLLPLLPKHVGVLCLDLPGHGYSCHMPDGLPYHSIEYLNVVQRVMEEYGWAKVSLLTHSMSSMLCLIFAALFPDRVDMLISIDVLYPPHYSSADTTIRTLRDNTDRMLIENERRAMAGMREPPSYSPEQLARVTHIGSSNSVDISHSHHIYERNVKRSLLFPEKYYFARDARLKSYYPFFVDGGFNRELIRRASKVPLCVVLGSHSHRPFSENVDYVADMQRRLNTHFELHVVEGSHHVHLNNAMGVAQVINPFICRFRPPLLEAWSVNEADSSATESGRAKRRQRDHRVRGTWSWRRSKL